MTPHDPAALADATAEDAAQEASMPRSDAEQGAHEESSQPTETSRTGDPRASRERIRLALIDLTRLAESCGWGYDLESGSAGRAKTYELTVWEPQPGGDEDA